MNLDITADLVRDLHETGASTKTGIVLTSTGWEIQSWINRSEYPIAITAADAWEVTGEFEFDDDIAEMLTTPSVPGATSYAVPDEDGDVRAPRDDEDVTVVTSTGEDEDEAGWIGAWWFDAATAVELVTDSDGELRDGGGTSSLWRTAGGRYVMCTRSCWDGEPGIAWTGLTPTQAAEWGYHAPQGRVAEDDTLPPLLVAAWHLRAVRDAITVPRVPVSASDPYQRYPEDVEDEAAEVVADARALLELARTILAQDLRAKRADAAHIVVEAVGSQQAAAARLGMSQPTLNNLIN